MLPAPLNPGGLVVPVDPVPVFPEDVEGSPESLPEEEVYSQPLNMASMRTGSASARKFICMNIPAQI
jgi:hypothetical protein